MNWLNITPKKGFVRSRQARGLWADRYVGGVRQFCASKRDLRRVVGNEHGQATVEFAVILAGFLALVVAMGVLWRSFEGGLFVSHALSAASHHVQGAALGVIADIFLY